MSDVHEDLVVTVEVSGHRLVIRAEDLDDFSLSIPSDVIQTGVTEGGAALRELGRTHISLTGIFKPDARPVWEEIK